MYVVSLLTCFFVLRKVAIFCLNSPTESSWAELIPQEKRKIKNTANFSLILRELIFNVLKDIYPNLSVDKNIFPLKNRLIYVVKVGFFVCFIQYYEYFVDK
tara:strand:- start:5081 stop:5383 length:303 start_codon:yes stop_codon:yes gene_type:complete